MIRDVSGMEQGVEQIACRVGRDVTLAALHWKIRWLVSRDVSVVRTQIYTDNISYVKYGWNVALPQRPRGVRIRAIQKP